jgi:hypothetical protein
MVRPFFIGVVAIAAVLGSSATLTLAVKLMNQPSDFAFCVGIFLIVLAMVAYPSVLFGFIRYSRKK